jgi:hypothetical protein
MAARSKLPPPNPGVAAGSVSRMNTRARDLRKEIKDTNPDKDLRPRLKDFDPSAGEAPKSYYSTLRNDWNRRQSKYEAREGEYKEQILALETEIAEVTAAGGAPPASDPHLIERAFVDLHDMHEVLGDGVIRGDV